jgi:intracellular multiplication protein IcmE
MQNENTPIEPQMADEIEHGFESEVPAPQPEAKHIAPSKSDEMKRNLAAVFGHGPGKFALIAVGLFVIGGVALGYRGLTKEKVRDESTSVMNVPVSPNQNAVDLSAVSEHEAARRKAIDAVEAEKAFASGKTYQPGFDPNIIAKSPTQVADQDTAKIDLGVAGAATGGTNKPTSPAHAMGSAGTPPPPTPPVAIVATPEKAQAPTPQQMQAAQQDAAKAATEYQTALAAREAYIKGIQDSVLKQVEKMLGGEGQAGINNVGTYGTTKYSPPPKVQTASPTSTSTSTPQVAVANATKAGDGKTVDAKKSKIIIKTGNILYFTLDSEVNTDDGGEVLATIRGGVWDGSKILGKVEQSPNNIRLKFNVLAPQDGRPTRTISAIALREVDAKQGVAENIDSHTLSRYTALAVSSALSGYGRAFSTPVGTTVIGPGGVISTTTTEPTDRQIRGQIVGEIGMASAAEVRKGFARPTTYSAPAQQGFGLYFLQDVLETNDEVAK